VLALFDFNPAGQETEDPEVEALVNEGKKPGSAKTMGRRTGSGKNCGSEMSRSKIPCMAAVVDDITAGTIRSGD